MPNTLLSATKNPDESVTHFENQGDPRVTESQPLLNDQLISKYEIKKQRPLSQYDAGKGGRRVNRLQRFM